MPIIIWRGKNYEGASANLLVRLLTFEWRAHGGDAASNTLDERRLIVEGFGGIEEGAGGLPAEKLAWSWLDSSRQDDGVR